MPASDQWKQILADSEGELSAVEGNLLSAARGKELRSLLVTSCRTGEGKSTSAACLAHALAVQGRAKVILVDGDLGDPHLHELLGVPAAPGLSDILQGRATLDQAVHATEYPRLSVLPSGASATEVANHLDIQGLGPILKDLVGRFQYIIFDGGAVQTSSDACVVGKLFDGVLLVVECEKTKWELLELAKDKISQAGGNVLGVVLNRRRYYLPRVLYGRV